MLIGGTIGAFDLLHVGHLRFLQACRARCDYLKVGVGADQTILNSKKRVPVIEQVLRLELVAGLACVDAVKLFDVGLDHTDAAAAWLAGWPVQVVFASEEWRPSPRWRNLEPALQNRGLAVIWLPYTEGISTSQIKERISRPPG